jgi:hypothetical protein
MSGMILKDIVSVGDTCSPSLKTGARKGIRLHKRANSGTSFWEYGIIGLELPGIDMKRALK